MRAAETTYDIGNGSLVSDQHERATMEVVEGEDGSEEVECHKVVLEAFFHDEKSEFHSDNFEDNFGSSFSRGRAPRADTSYRADRVVIVRDEYAHGDIRVFSIHHVPKYVESNRYSIIHAPDEYQGPDHVNTVTAENARQD